MGDSPGDEAGLSATLIGHQKTKLSQSPTDRIRASSKAEDLLEEVYAHPRVTCACRSRG
jgi:hypothetical protein